MQGFQKGIPPGKRAMQGFQRIPAKSGQWKEIVRERRRNGSIRTIAPVLPGRRCNMCDKSMRRARGRGTTCVAHHNHIVAPAGRSVLSPSLRHHHLHHQHLHCHQNMWCPTVWRVETTQLPMWLCRSSTKARTAPSSSSPRWTHSQTPAFLSTFLARGNA